jgi:hypothetical protein
VATETERTHYRLAEVAYFLREMRRVQDHSQHFIFELSAFLSACKNLSYHLGAVYGRQWYKAIQRRVEAGEFKYIGVYLKLRDVNVHRDPLEVLRDTHLMFPDGMPDGFPDDGGSFLVDINQRGDIMSAHYVPEGGTVAAKPLSFTSKHRYFFPGGEVTGQDILVECELCYRELAKIVIEATQGAQGNPLSASQGE